MLRSATIGLVVLAFASPQVTPTIDLTGVVPRDRVRTPLTATSSGGSAGGNGSMSEQKSPIDMTILSVEFAHDTPQPSLVFEVQVLNAGSQEF